MSDDLKRPQPPLAPVTPLRQAPVPIQQPPEEPREPKSALWLRWLLFAAVAALIVLLLALFLLTRTDLFAGEQPLQPQHLSFDTYGSSSYCLVDGGLCRATQTGVTLYDPQGRLLAQHQGSFPTPYVLGSRSNLLACGIGGSDLQLLDAQGRELLQLNTPGPIYDADLSPEGSACLLYGSPDSRAVLEVYSAKGALLFRRSSKSQHMNSCAISPAGDYAAVTVMGQQDIAFLTRAQVFRTSQEEVYAEFSLGGQMIYELAFLDEQTLCAIGESSIQIFNVQGEKLQDYPLSDGALLCHDVGEGVIVFACDLYEAGSSCRLVSLDGQGVQAKTVLDSPVSDLSLSEDGLAVLQNFEAAIYSLSLEPLDQQELEVAYSAIELRPDGAAYLIGESAAELYIPEA